MGMINPVVNLVGLEGTNVNTNPDTKTNTNKDKDKLM